MTDIGRQVYEALWSGRGRPGKIAFGDADHDALVTVRRSLSGRIELIVAVKGQREVAYLESDGRLTAGGTAAEDAAARPLLVSDHVEGGPPSPFVRVRAHEDEKRLDYHGPPVPKQKSSGRPTP